MLVVTWRWWQLLQGGPDPGLGRALNSRVRRDVRSRVRAGTAGGSPSGAAICGRAASAGAGYPRRRTASRGSWLPWKLTIQVFDDVASEHHHPDVHGVGEDRRVAQWIGVEHDQVGALALFDGAGLLLDAH